MTVEVVCPGCEAKVICPQERIGQAGKCPKCGTQFEIRDPHEPDNEDPDIIAFLCPNGHKLSGPASLQGKPGQCPHCGMRFVIPDYSAEDDDTDDALAEEFAADEAPVEAGSGLDDLEELGSLGGFDALPELNEPAVSSLPASPPAGPAVIAVTSSAAAPSAELGMEIGAHPMAQTFATFWARRTDGAAVEIQLRSGERIRPERYAAAASLQEQGFFALKNDDGTYTLIAAAWDAVERITVRGLPELPSDLFGV